MKIALVILHADASRGGAERYTIDLAAALAAAGHSVSLLATSFASRPAGIDAVLLPAGGITRAGRYRQMLDALDTHLAATEYDIVHAMLPVRKCDLYHPHAGIALAALRRWNVHLNPRRKRMAEVERDLLTGNRPPVVLCLSDYVKASVREFYPGIDNRLATLFNAVDLCRFEPTPRPQRDQIRALFIGQDFERKGLHQTIAAMRKLNDPRLKLTVVGKHAGREHSQDARIEFVGQVSDPRPYYRDADFFVLPTRHDPCSLVVLEALAMGLPVISTRFNGACEIMTNGTHGFVLDDPADVDSLAVAIQRLLDPALRAKMSASCVELRPKLSYSSHLSNLIGIYRQVEHRSSAAAR